MVFIRLTGDVDAEAPLDLIPIGERRAHASNIEIGTGSGFLITPNGHVPTCAHVVTDSVETVRLGRAKVTVKLTVRRIEAVLPALPDDPQRTEARTYEATVLALDPDLDLALLSISAFALPYLHLGDSDGLEPGDPVTVISYPFGRAVEIGKPPAAESFEAPDPSVSRGNVSASPAT